uniref:Peptidase S1 domain-containing protein n=1 Tax=Timema douglasi TaxID=61478 RepID=A0A7R8ZH33_TIMDO|nr:unnamed protein product [Timema douglasi]
MAVTWTILGAVIIMVVACATAAPHIIGGRNANEGEFPYQISLQRKNYFGGGSYHWCGGSLIDHQHVLTAAHCVTGVPLEEYLVIPGLLNITYGNTSPNYSVAEIFIHEYFSSDELYNDIAVLKLNKSIQYDQDIQPISLRHDRVKTGTECTVTGWGLVSDVRWAHARLRVALSVGRECRGVDL